MTDKSLSKQICKACNIEPIKDETAYFTGNVNKLPDFENNNNNFVKLFELSLPKICGTQFTISQLLCESIEFKFSDKRTFLVQLIIFFNVYKSFGRYVKKVIRETD